MNTLPVIVCVFVIYIVGVLCTSDDPGDYYADIEYDKLHKSESTSHQYNSKTEYSKSTKQESSSKTNKEHSGATTYRDHTPGDYYEDIEYDKLPHNQHAAIVSPDEVVTRVKSTSTDVITRVKDTKPVGSPKKKSKEKKKASGSSSSSSSEEETKVNNDRRDHDPGSWYS